MKALFLTILLAAPPALAAQKNILLIIADDYGVDSSSLYNTTNSGASLPPTPTINSLAQSGVLFRNAYAQPVCSPTRACIITGRHAFRTGIGDVIAGAGSTVLTSSEFTLPEAFAANSGLGYQLAAFGKWHLNNQANSPNSIGGWPHFAGSLIGALTSYTNWSKTVNGVSSTTTNYATTDVVNDAIAWIQSQSNHPWFAWVAFNAPHTPLHKPPNSLCPHYTSLSGTTADINARPAQYFDAMIEAMDTEMARLLTVVDRTNTHIIFLGDNGSTPQTIQPPFTTLRSKGSVYEGGIHVPFIIAGPAVATPGTTNDTPVHVVDVFATILDMAGINMATTVPSSITIDSQSVLSAVQSNLPLARYVYAEKFGTNTPTADARSLRNAQYKLIQFTNYSEEFYDLAADPYESTNLLTRTMTAAQQANYYALELKLGTYQTKLATPTILTTSRSNGQFTATVTRTNGVTSSLWRGSSVDPLTWTPVTNAVIATNAATISLTDPSSLSAGAFYRVGWR